MEMEQLSSSADPEKKRKFVNNECDHKHLEHNSQKIFKTRFQNPRSDFKSVPNSKPQKKHFNAVNKIKSKVHNHFKENGSSTTTVVSSDRIDVPVSHEKYHGTNGSGLIKKPLKQYAKDQNENHEKNILLARIERKGVCTNWKTFKEVLKKDENVNGQASKLITGKIANHMHRSEMHKNHRKSFKHKKNPICSAPNINENIKPNSENTLDRKHSDYKTKHLISDTINGDLKSVTASDNLKKLKKPHSRNFQNGKEGKAADSEKGLKGSIGNTSHKNSKRLTKQIALDCEMVGTEDNSDMVARVSLVNKFGECVYDKYVTPTEKVQDYRTWVSGIRPENLKNAEDFKQVQKEVAELLQGRLLIGHAVQNDLKVLFLSHPRKYTRDTQRFKLFRELAKSKRPSLKKLALTILNISIQEGEHNSVEDAKVAMQLYMLYQKKWEKRLREPKKKLCTTTTTAAPT